MIFQTRYQAKKHAASGDVVVKVEGGYAVMKQNELKPCPFCGGDDICMARNYEGQWRIICANCEAIVWVGDSRNEVSVRDAWNRRVSG